MHVSPLMRAAAYSTHALSLPFYAYACDRIQSPPLVRPLVGALSIIQLGLGYPNPIMAVVIVCIRLCQNPRSWICNFLLILGSMDRLNTSKNGWIRHLCALLLWTTCRWRTMS